MATISTDNTDETSRPPLGQRAQILIAQVLAGICGLIWSIVKGIFWDFPREVYEDCKPDPPSVPLKGPTLRFYQLVNMLTKPTILIALAWLFLGLYSFYQWWTTGHWKW